MAVYEVELNGEVYQVEASNDTELQGAYNELLKTISPYTPTADGDFTGNVSPQGIPLRAGENMPDAPEKETSFLGEIAGIGETGLAIGSAMTGGTAGHLEGFVRGNIEGMMEGMSPEQRAAHAKKLSEQYSQELTYQPRTEEGQRNVQAIGKVAQALEPITPMAGEIGAVARNIRQAPQLQEAGRLIKEAIPKGTPKPTVKPAMTTEEIGKVAKKAADGSKSARLQLAEEAKINPQAVEAAERLGIELPADVLGDSTLLKQTAGLVRSQIGDESAKFADTITAAASKADDIMDNLGKTDIATVSGKVLDNLNKTRTSLLESSEGIYKNVSSKIPKSTSVQLSNSKRVIGEIFDELGGAKNLTKEEKSLFNLLTSENVTYEALNRERRLIGKALGKMPQGKYANADSAVLGRLYAALKSDQLDNVEAILGKEGRTQLHLADRTFQKKIAFDERISKTFGVEGEGSIASLLKRSINQGKGGDITALNKVLKTVPKELRKEAIVSALGDVIESSRGVDAGTFDFGKYAKTYQGLRKNAPVYSAIIKEVGSDKHQLLNDLYIVSKRISDAKSNIITTGKANQEILKQMQSEALLNKVIRVTVETGASKVTGGLLRPNIDGLLKSSGDTIKAVGELIRSNEFKDLAVEMVGKKPSSGKIKSFINSNSFKKWQNQTGQTIKDPEAWVYGALTQEKETK